MFRRIFTPLCLSVLLLAGCDTTPSKSFPSVPADRDASDRPRSGPALGYPAPLLVQRREGTVTVECTVLTTGATQNCKVIDGAEEAEFRQAALDFTMHSVYVPGIRNGVAADTEKRWTLPFRLQPGVSGEDGDHRWLPEGALPIRAVAGEQPIYPPLMQMNSREGVAEIECLVTIEGTTKDCRATRMAGGAQFLYAAFYFQQHRHFAPALLQGKPIEVRHSWIITFRLTPPVGEVPTLPDTPQPINLPASAQPIDRAVIRWRAGTPNMPAKSGSAQVSCLVAVDGKTKDCSIAASSGDKEDDAGLLQLFKTLWFGPALRDGVPYEARAAWSLTYTPSYAEIGSVTKAD